MLSTRIRFSKRRTRTRTVTSPGRSSPAQKETWTRKSPLVREEPLLSMRRINRRINFRKALPREKASISSHHQEQQQQREQEEEEEEEEEEGRSLRQRLFLGLRSKHRELRRGGSYSYRTPRHREMLNKCQML